MPVSEGSNVALINSILNDESVPFLILGMLVTALAIGHSSLIQVL